MGRMFYVPPPSEQPPKLSSDPSSPSLGQIWFNTTEGKLKYFDGTQIRRIDINQGQVCDVFGSPIENMDI